jgi:hypothetical protein
MMHDVFHIIMSVAIITMETTKDTNKHAQINPDRPGDLLTQIKEVKVDVVESLTIVYMGDPISTEKSELDATIDAFRRIAILGRRIKLKLRGCEGLVGAILYQALAVNSISEITFQGTPPQGGETLPSPDICSSLCWGMKYRQLEAIRFNHCTISKEQVGYLRDGMITGGGCRLKCLSFWTVKFWVEGMAALAAGLEQNWTLQKLSFCQCSLINTLVVTDSEVAKVAKALLRTPSLRNLEMSFIEFGMEARAALAELITKNQELEHLELVLLDLKCGIDPLASAFEGHSSLKRLDLSYNDFTDCDLQAIARVLPSMPKLQTLELVLPRSFLFGPLLARCNLPASLRHVYLDKEDYDPDLILKMLEDNPTLVWVGRHPVFMTPQGLPPWTFPEQIQHLMDANESGRVLLCAGGNVPLYLWPLVLERANGLFMPPNCAERFVCHDPTRRGRKRAKREADKKFNRRMEEEVRKSKRRRANVIFTLLQGPALMGRRP